MGSNPTQAIASFLFMFAFVFIAFGCSQGYGFLAILAGLVTLAVSIFLFRKAKPWEHLENGDRI